MKVLIIRFSSIGDIVLTTPVIRCLKQQHKNVEVHYLTKSSFKDVLIGNPYIDKLHLFKDDLNAVIEELIAESFDFIIDLHNNLRTSRVKKALDVPSAAYPKLNIKKWLYTNFKLDVMPDQSIVERYFVPAAEIKVQNDGRGLDYFVPKDVKLSEDDIPMSHWSGFVGCVIGGSYATKKLPVEQWKKLCELIPYPIILLGGPEDKEEGDLIASIDPIRIYNSCGKFALNESAELVRLSKVVLSNDTGLMHIAAAYKKPIISFWGNTSPEMGMFPYYGYNNFKSRPLAQSIFVENKAISCHPCSKLGYKKCPKGHFKCMNSLDMANVAAETQKLWSFNQKVEAKSSSSI